MATLGPFELIQKLGAGATAEVFLARGPNARGEELIALKVMLEHLADDEGTRRAFLQEGRTAALLRHSNIVEVFDVGEIEGRAYLAMELVRGWSVAALLKKLKAAKEALSVDEACEVIRQAALGLHFAHEIRGANGHPLGLVHRDVSPQNLIVSEKGEVKVADFGLAKATAAQATVTRGLRGKLRYMPPEQLRGEPLDARSDVFALGAVLWEVVTGHPLYPGLNEPEIFQQALFNPQPHPDEVVLGLSRALVDVLQKAVERDPQRRYQTALILAEQLLPLIQPGQSALKLGAQIQKHFEPLPRAGADSTGAVTQTVKRHLPFPAPSSRLKPRLPDPREGPTQTSLPPVMDPPSVTEHPANETLHDVYVNASHTFLSVPSPRRSPRILISALALAGLAIFTGSVAVGRYLNRTTFEEIPISQPVDDEPVDSADAPQAVDESKSALKKKPHEISRGFVTIDSNVPALVSAGGKDLGMTPLKLNLPVGRYRLKVVTPDGSLSNELDLTLLIGGNGHRTVQLR